MSIEQPSLATAVRGHVDAGLARVHTLLPATVLSYDAALQRATVRVSIRGRVQDPETGDLIPAVQSETIPNCPVVWQGGAAGATSMTFPLLPGDPVMVQFAERSTDEWLAQGGEVVPQDVRRHDFSDGVVQAGLRSFAAPLPATAVDPVSAVLRGGVANPVKLGDNTAVDGVLKGTTFEADLSTFLTALQVFVTACSTAATAAQVAAAAVTFLPSVVAFASSVSSGAHQSLRVKVS